MRSFGANLVPRDISYIGLLRQFVVSGSHMLIMCESGRRLPSFRSSNRVSEVCPALSETSPESLWLNQASSSTGRARSAARGPLDSAPDLVLASRATGSIDVSRDKASDCSAVRTKSRPPEGSSKLATLRPVAAPLTQITLKNEADLDDRTDR